MCSLVVSIVSYCDVLSSVNSICGYRSWSFEGGSSEDACQGHAEVPDLGATRPAGADRHAAVVR